MIKSILFIITLIGVNVATAFAPAAEPVTALDTRMGYMYVQHGQEIATERQQLKDYVLSLIPTEYATHIERVNRDLYIPYEIIFALVYEESRWNSRATGYNGNDTYDIGLFQLNSQYVHYFAEKYIGHVQINPYDPVVNIEIGMKHLAELHRDFGNWHDALAAYNAGSSRVIANRIPASTMQYRERILTRSDSIRINSI